MRVNHVVSSLSLKSGGPSLSILSLVKCLRDYNCRAEIVTFLTEDDGTLSSHDDSYVHKLAKLKGRRFAYTSELRLHLVGLKADLFHGHGLWQHPVYVMSKLSRNIDKPYIISPRGMLYPDALKKSAIFKKIAWFLFQSRDLRMATVIHATCFDEMKHIRALGLKNSVAIVPNAISTTLNSKGIKDVKSDKRRVGFVGRFAPIKNLEVLISAWSIVGKNNRDWELVLVGDGEKRYKEVLLKLVLKYEIKNIVFTGFLSGEEKDIEFSSLDCLVLPSKSENFGMVVPEALLRKIPVIASKGTPWQELDTHNAGWWIDIGVEPLVKTLIEAMNMKPEDLGIMGKNGRLLVEQNYNIEVVSKKMIELYDWVLNKGSKPDFVYE